MWSWGASQRRCLCTELPGMRIRGKEGSEKAVSLVGHWRDGEKANEAASYSWQGESGRKWVLGWGVGPNQMRGELSLGTLIDRCTYIWILVPSSAWMPMGWWLKLPELYLSLKWVNNPTLRMELMTEVHKGPRTVMAGFEHEVHILFISSLELLLQIVNMVTMLPGSHLPPKPGAILSTAEIHRVRVTFPSIQCLPNLIF